MKVKANKKSKVGFKVKRFMKVHKVIVSLVLTVLLALLCYSTLMSVIKDTTQLVQLPVAHKHLPSGTKITEQDIVFIDVPKYIVNDDVYKNKNDIIGKYVNNYQSVASKSLFYKELISDEKDINDINMFKLESGEIAISLDVDIKSSYANSVLPGHFIDLYFLGNVRSENNPNATLIYGELVKNVRIIGVKDKFGKNVSESSEATAVIIVAVTQKDGHIIELAKAIGEVKPIISYGNITDVEDGEYYDLAKIRNILLGQSIDVTLIPSKEEDHNDE